MQRLVSDMDRLELQLENSLLLSTFDNSKVNLELIKISELLSKLRFEFSDIEISLQKDFAVRADVRTLTSVFRNILQNSRQHGRASRLDILTEDRSPMLRIQLKDNGRADSNKEVSVKSSTGMGLNLSKQLIQRMGGRLQTRQEQSGFTVILELPLPKQVGP